MKKIVLLSLAFTLLCCSKENEQQAQPDRGIYGKWFQKETIVNNITIPYDDHEPCGKDYIVFYDENKIKSIDVWSCVENIDWIGTFVKTNNNLQIINGTESLVVEIIVLDSTTLLYKYAFDSNNDGIKENYVETFNR